MSRTTAAAAETDEPLLTLLNAVVQREREALVAALARRGFAGVSLPAVRLLAEVKAGPKSVQALADATGTTKQFCGREVKRLADAGYLGVHPSDEDRRALVVSLLERGRRLMAAAREVKHELDAGIARRLGERDARLLRRLLARLATD